MPLARNQLWEDTQYTVVCFLWLCSFSGLLLHPGSTCPGVTLAPGEVGQPPEEPHLLFEPVLSLPLEYVGQLRCPHSPWAWLALLDV